MHCSTNGLNSIADWWWVPSGGTELIPIFQSNTLVYLYDNHMEVSHGSNGQHDLVIHNVKFSDAGNYTCYDDGRLQSAVENGYFASAELVAIGSFKFIKTTSNRFFKINYSCCCSCRIYLFYIILSRIKQRMYNTRCVMQTTHSYYWLIYLI